MTKNKKERGEYKKDGHASYADKGSHGERHSFTTWVRRFLGRGTNDIPTSPFKDYDFILNSTPQRVDSAEYQRRRRHMPRHGRRDGK